MEQHPIPLNDNGFTLRNIAVSDILLDLDNPRIRLLGARNQREAVVQIFLSRSDQLYHLARDICENGMTIMPIVVTDGPDDNSLIVKDGNRRIAALKLIRQPDWLPNEPERHRFMRLRQRITNIPEQITVYHSNDPKRIMLFIDRLHTGTGQGEGQLEWSAVEKALFELDRGERGQNDLAARLLRTALGLGIPFNPEFPITTLTRLLNNARLHRIGIQVENDGKLKIVDDEKVVALRLRTLIDNIGRSEVHVRRDNSPGSIYTPAAQEAYLDRLLSQYPSPRPASPVDADESTGHADVVNEDRAPAPSPTKPASALSTTQRQITHSPRKDPYDRNKIIQRKEHQINLLPTANPPEKALALYQELRILVLPISRHLLSNHLIRCPRKRVNSILPSHCCPINFHENRRLV